MVGITRILGFTVLAAAVMLSGCDAANTAATAQKEAAPVSSPPLVVAQQTDYLINPGDVLEISVWKEEGMEKEVLVLPDGTISFPLVGFVPAAGKTPPEVQRLITGKIKEYIPIPVVTLSVKEVAGNTIYVIGYVEEPGQFHTVRPIDVLQALSLAGGLDPIAHEEEIRIIRRDGGAQRVFNFNYAEIKKGEGLQNNIVLQSGDVVVVPGGGFFQ